MASIWQDRSRILLFLLLPTLLGFSWSPESWELQIGKSTQRGSAWATSDRCQSCHQDHYASWSQTYHRTMTQEAASSSVVAEFDGRSVKQWGKIIRPIMREGRYYFDYMDARGRLDRSVEIVRTVGSHRYQQYLALLPDSDSTYYRLEILWHVEEKKWVHLNAAFLGPDQQSFESHYATWNHNCIFCHNTGVEPNIKNLKSIEDTARQGIAIDLEKDARYESRVAELGIACETCHGPGEEHAQLNRNPLRRYFLHLTDIDDPSITNPRKLDADRSTYVCGQCHGQRTPKLDYLQRWVTDGPTYRPGDDLQEHVNLVWSDSEIPSQVASDLFQMRFWQDGTPRLSAYELQGTLQSQCYQKSQLTCISCHSAHRGDPAGMLPEENKTNQVCTQCHEQNDDELVAHTQHQKDSSGSQCVNCHMPKIVYGVMEIHRSHRIEIPSPRMNSSNARPNACTNCHLDKSIQWADLEMGRKWPGSVARDLLQRQDGAPIETVDSIAQLWAGDPVQRAVLAHQIGREDSPLPPLSRAFFIPHLLGILSHNYPSARRFALKSLMSIELGLAQEGVDLGMKQKLAEFDYTFQLEERNPIIKQLWLQWQSVPKDIFPTPPVGANLNADYQLLKEPMAELLRLGEKNTQQINIGE